MSPNGRNLGGRGTAASNVYTIILALAFMAVSATMVFVLLRCYLHYGSIFSIR